MDGRGFVPADHDRPITARIQLALVSLVQASLGGADWPCFFAGEPGSAMTIKRLALASLDQALAGRGWPLFSLSDAGQPWTKLSWPRLA